MLAVCQVGGVHGQHLAGGGAFSDLALDILAEHLKLERFDDAGSALEHGEQQINRLLAVVKGRRGVARFFFCRGRFHRLLGLVLGHGGEAGPLAEDVGHLREEFL